MTASRRATMLRDVRVTDDRAKVPAVVLVHAPKMKEAWCLATTLSERKAGDIVKLYGKMRIPTDVTARSGATRRPSPG